MASKSTRRLFSETKSAVNAVSRNLRQIAKSTPMTLSAIEQQALQLAQQRRVLIEQNAELHSKQQLAEQKVQSDSHHKTVAKTDHDAAKRTLDKQRKVVKDARSNRKACESSIKKTKRQIKAHAKKINKLKSSQADTKPITVTIKKVARAEKLGAKAQKLSDKIKAARVKLHKETKIAKDELAILQRHEEQYPGHCTKDIAKIGRKLKTNQRKMTRLTSRQRMVDVKAAGYRVEESAAKIELLAAKQEFKAKHPEVGKDIEAFAENQQAKIASEQKQQRALGKQLGEQQGELTSAKRSEKSANTCLKSCRRHRNKMQKRHKSAAKQLKRSKNVLGKITQMAKKLDALAERISQRFSRLKTKLSSTKVSHNSMASASKAPTESNPHETDPTYSTKSTLRHK